MSRAADWIRPQIQAMQAYQVPDASGQIKLDAMENPYPWPQSLRQAWLDALQTVAVNRYPDPAARDLQAAIRQHLALPDELGLLLGNGSDEIIQMIALALGGAGRTILSVEPGFVMYRMIAAFCGLNYVGVPLRADDFSLDVAALETAIRSHRPAIVFLAYPNNPTGNLFAAQEICDIIALAPGLVVIDEAYAPFTQASFLSELGRHDNLLVMRTFSKWGLAGLRLGYLAGPREWLDELDKVRLPYNINVLTQVSTAFALRHETIFKAQTQAICRARESLYQALSAYPEIEVFPSEANFILVRFLRAERAVQVFDGLLQAGIRIKNLHGSHPLLTGCLRITVGTPEENQALLDALKNLL